MQNPGALLHLDSSDLALYTEVSAGFRKVLNHHNCESAMLWRRAKVNRNPISIAFLRSQAGKLERLEREVCHRFNVNLTVSSEDSVLLQKINPQAHFHVVENGTDTDYFQPLGLAEEPNSLVFAGSLDWYPNQSALQYFRAEIWPELRRTVSDIRLEMAGRNPAEWMTKWAEEDSRVTLTPNPEDIRPSMDRGAVFLCPIVDGGGTRLKLLDAMAMGKAIVTTSIGCEGLRAVPGRELMVADSPADFSAAVLRLLRDEPLRWKLQQAAREFVVQEYSWNRIGEQLEEAYQEAIGSSESGSLRVSAKHAPVM
ncbi:MAG: glycosyltransferase family 4 protein [Candidatus Korobacteraceae bacterium]